MTKSRVEPDARRLTPQQPRAQRVKRREPDSVARSAQHRFDALPHLACGFIGEGDRQHFVRRGVSVADEIRDAIGDDACLSRAGARQNQQRPVDVQHGLTLFGVEILEEGHWAETGRDQYSWCPRVEELVTTRGPSQTAARLICETSPNRCAFGKSALNR